jgi:hypothetical protein
MTYVNINNLIHFCLIKRHFEVFQRLYSHASWSGGKSNHQPQIALRSIWACISTRYISPSTCQSYAAINAASSACKPCSSSAKLILIPLKKNGRKLKLFVVKKNVLLMSFLNSAFNNHFIDG